MPAMNFQRLFDSGPVVVISWNIQNGWPVTFISANAENLFGYPPGEFTAGGITFDDILHPDDRGPFRSTILKCIDENKDFHAFEPFRIHHRNGDIHWLSGTCIFDLDDRGHCRVTACLADITEQKSMEERLRLLINSTPDIICFKDGEGRWLEANEADLELFALKDVDYRGKTDSELAEYTHPIFREAFLTCEKTDEKAWAAKGVVRGEEVIPRPDGAPKVYDVIKSSLYTKDGRRKGLVVLGRDITDLKNIQDRLKQQLKLSQALNKVSQQIILENDQEKILDTTARIAGETLELDRCIIYRIDINEKKALPLSEWIDPSVKDIAPASAVYTIKHFPKSGPYVVKTKKHIESHVDSVHPIFLSEGSANMLHSKFNIKSLLWFPFAFEKDNVYLLTFSHVKKTHHWRDYELAFVNSLAHQVELALMKIRFLLEKEQSSAEIRRLAAVVRQASEAIVVTNIDGRIEYVNPAFEKITGYAAEEVRGKSIAILRSGKDSDVFYKEIWESIRKGNVWRGESINCRKDGTEYNEKAVIFPIKNQAGEIINVCKIARDVSREIQLEMQLRQAQKMEAVGTLAGGVAHDFNNILTVINGYAEFALTHLDKDSVLYKDIESILDAGKRAEELVAKLLAFSRKQIFKPEIISVNQVIISMENMLKRLIGEDILISTDLKKNLPFIRADKSQVEQILMNLVINARDAVRAVRKTDFRKRIIIETGTMFLDEAYIAEHPDCRIGEHIYFSVSDNGIGMDQLVQARIFEPFFTTKDSHKGTGLGLSTVYGIVRQNHAHIHVYSEPGKGSTFKVIWPIATKKEFERKIETKKVRLSGRERILLLEDNPGVCRFATRALSSLGYQVTSTTSASKALKFIESEKQTFDLIITDLVMPEMNGIDFIKRVRETVPGIKVLYVSGYTDNYVMHNGILDSDINFLSKPYAIKTLAQHVRRILDA